MDTFADESHLSGEKGLTRVITPRLPGDNMPGGQVSTLFQSLLDGRAGRDFANADILPKISFEFFALLP
jgi:hypothetical protein